MGRLPVIVGAVVASVLVANEAFIWVSREVVFSRQIVFVDESDTKARAAIVGSEAEAEARPTLPKPVPFEEIEAFVDGEGLNWSQPLSLFGGGGVTVFDANGDGRPDVYLSLDGQSWSRATDAEGALEDKPRPMSNMLLLNQGNDAEGRPRFHSIGRLAAANDEYVEEELLVEGYLFPRRSVKEPRLRPGRASNVAVAADFNGDGRPDLLVGNAPPGIPWSHPETQRVLVRFINPLERQARHSKLPLASLPNHFFPYIPRQSLDETRKSARGTESAGANSLYINMGDKDGDGLPEWRDASREANIEGRRTSSGLAVADVDLDGDLDLYVANAMDLDYWPGGSKGWAGGANRLYINQLAETGALRFVEKAGAMGCDGVFDEDYPQPDFYRGRQIPLLPVEYSFPLMKFEKYRPKLLEINGGKAEAAEISWSTVFQDVNDDGYPDLWVANDLGKLRLYENQAGKTFRDRPHGRSKRTGMWMSLAPADYSGDGAEDLVIGNLGGGLYNNAFVAPDVYGVVSEAPVLIDTLAAAVFFHDAHDTTHGLLDGADVNRELAHRVFHSKVLPPETSLRANRRTGVGDRTMGTPWKADVPATPFNPDSLDPYEFSWGMTPVDVQNDGRQDFYYVGCLYTRGGGLFPVIGSGPGRLLVNAREQGGPLQFVDQTAEYQLFNILELRYDKLSSEGYVYRRSPAQNWNKRDTVTSFDRSSWISQGVGIQERVTNSDLLQTVENGRATVAADLNGDGYQDIVVTNAGGYDSRSSEAVNLKVRKDGRARVVPPPDAHYFSLTNFDPGRTRVFVNRCVGNNYLKLRLVSDSEGCFNREAIGAKVLVNGRHLRVKRAGDGGYLGNTAVDIHIGLGAEQGGRVEVRWPDRARTKTVVELEGRTNGLAVISKAHGLIEWRPRDEAAGAAPRPSSEAPQRGG